MNRIEHAIVYATEKHSGQLRKGTFLPYIVHPMEVFSILSRISDDEDLLIAGILHDTVEDTDASYDEISALFGDRVAELVGAHTSDKTVDWWESRQRAIEHLRTAERSVKLLVLADKLSNLRSMANDYKTIGDALWDRFNAPKEMQSRYYSLSIDVMKDFMNDPDAKQAYWELNTLYKDVFVTFYINESHDCLIQKAAHGEGCYLCKTDLAWMPLPEQWTLTEIPRTEAEFIEDVWRYV